MLDPCACCGAPGIPVNNTEGEIELYGVMAPRWTCDCGYHVLCLRHDRQRCVFHCPCSVRQKKRSEKLHAAKLAERKMLKKATVRLPFDDIHERTEHDDQGGGK